MVGLSPQPWQLPATSGYDAADPVLVELRALAAAAERDRKPAGELLDLVASDRFPIPRGPDGRVDPLAVVLAAQRYGQADPGAALVITGAWHLPLIVDAVGSDMQRTSTLPKLTAALLYEGFGRRPSEYRTQATRTADGWVLEGRKESVLLPGIGTRSVVVARAGDALEAFLLDELPTGLSIERDDATDGKLGLRAAHTGAVRLAGVRLPESSRLAGTETAADPLVLHRAVALCRLTLAGVALGTASACLGYALDWARTRSAFGRKIASYQGVSFPLADLRTALEATDLLLRDTVTGLARVGDVATLEARTGRTVARAGAIATDAGRTAVNILGVHGIVTEHPVERWYRASAALSAIDFDPLTVALDVV